MRSNGCGDLRKQQIDDQVQLCGWVDRRRDHGGVIFIEASIAIILFLLTKPNYFIPSLLFFEELAKFR